MSHHCASSCGHTHIKYDIPRCQVIMTHHAVTNAHIKYDTPRCQTSVTHPVVTQILNMTNLDVNSL